jgi:hypothetical protein
MIAERSEYEAFLKVALERLTVSWSFIAFHAGMSFAGTKDACKQHTES